MRKFLVTLALLVAGVAGSLVVLTWLTWQHVKTAGLKANFRVLLWARVWSLVYRVPFPLVVGILANECASVDHDGRYPLGDQTIAKGPAVGPGQVLRINVERLWSSAPWWLFVKADSVDELANVGQERRALWVSVKVMREALDAARGDLHDAARRYNGSGAAAERYADRADGTRERFA